MRKEASHRSEMVSQLLFGEFVKRQEQSGDFAKVICLFDGYEGWVQANQLTPVADAEVREAAAYTNSFSSLVAVGSSSVQAPFATPVYHPETLRVSIGGKAIHHLLAPQQIWHSGQLILSQATLEAACQPYLNTPYLWGGRSVYGTDCSGFVQQVFKLFGRKLLRDAFLQAGQGGTVSTVNEVRLGDLAFFQNEKGRVTHVGIVLDDLRIVHASGRVRIDQLDENGIVNSESGERTHHLHSIKRYF
jgi:cell wall-associated NlpC family hydrolase